MELYNLRMFPLISPLHSHGASQMALVVKNPPANAGDIRDLGLIPGSGRSPGGGHGNPPWPGEPLKSTTVGILCASLYF